MTQEADITNLQQMLDRIEQSAKDQERVSLGKIVEGVGSRSFGPLLLLAGVIMASPLTGIPSMPTTMGILVLLIATQLLFRKQHFWLPDWLLKRSVAAEKLAKGVEWLRPSARFIDRWLRPRLPVFIDGVSIYIIAIACIAIALSMPAMELVPLSAHIAGLALTAFGLSLIARDGLLALLAFVATAITFGLIVYNLL
ncbi:MAG: exopolysaccharide biosynthesis protein [Geobacteraceae bacterium GWC2_58_44]|nr:MAG: exopolysaccharide biosynthesis protein [Geobacteraceae bacterium GWC2_58_44]HBG07601.1 exopolysaccharide biosynthesis protein [Geobacter sp.]